MMKRYKIVIAIFGLTLAGCGGGSNSSGGSTSFAPSSITDKTYNFTVTSGAGIYATAGTWSLKASSTANTYDVTGDGVNVADSSGSYTYSASENIGTINIVDSSIGNGKFILTFSSLTTGSFLATADSDASSNQKGTFRESDGSIPTISISGISGTTSINEAAIFNLDLSGTSNTVTILNGNMVNNIELSGVSNMLTIQSGVTINSIDASGTNNTVIVPIGSGITFTSNSGINNRLIEQ